MSGHMKPVLAPLGLWSEEGRTKTGAYLFSVCRDNVGPSPEGWLDVVHSDDRGHECVLEVRGKTEAEAKDRALLIVRAVNNHDALLDALRELVRCHAGGGFVQPDDEVLETARAVIAKAEGR